MKNIETDIIINAPAHLVWKVLMDRENFKDWNPFIKEFTGDLEAGRKVSVTLQPEGQKKMTFKPIILAAEEERELRWLGSLFIKGLFDGEHYFILEVLDKDTTRFVHGEKFSGILVAPLMKMMEDSTLSGFKSMNQAVKLRSEELIVKAVI